MLRLTVVAPGGYLDKYLRIVLGGDGIFHHLRLFYLLGGHSRGVVKVSDNHAVGHYQVLAPHIVEGLRHIPTEGVGAQFLNPRVYLLAVAVE